MCEAIDGEKDPQCLMIVFHLVELLAPLFPSPSGPLASDASDLFEVIGCYFPLHFTHTKDDEANIRREDLSRGLLLAISSTPFFEPYAIPLLLEKLSSSLPVAKVRLTCSFLLIHLDYMPLRMLDKCSYFCSTQTCIG
jgi:DNA repair/transcription protein MET18/MMS19